MRRPHLTAAIGSAAMLCLVACVHGSPATPTESPSTASGRGQSDIPALRVTFDGKSLPLQAGPTCIGDGQNILAMSKVEGTGEGEVMADIRIHPSLAVNSLQVKGVGADYFWETTSTGGEQMTVTKTDRTIVISGKIPNLKDRTDKKPLEIRAENCPGT